VSALIFDHPQVITKWVGERCGKEFKIWDTAIGVVDKAGNITGGFVFTNYTGSSVEISLAGRGCFQRDAWRGVFNYVFRQLGCTRLSMHTAFGNKFIRTWASKGGWTFEGRARRLYGRGDGLTFSITVDDLPALQKRWRL
jgi:hypothetical protein